MASGVAVPEIRMYFWEVTRSLQPIIASNPAMRSHVIVVYEVEPPILGVPYHFTHATVQGGGI